MEWFPPVPPNAENVGMFTHGALRKCCLDMEVDLCLYYAIKQNRFESRTSTVGNERGRFEVHDEAERDSGGERIENQCKSFGFANKSFGFPLIHFLSHLFYLQ